MSRKQNTGAVVRSVGPSFNRPTKEVIQSAGKNLSGVQPSIQLTGNSTSKSLAPIGTPAQKLPEPDAGPSSLKYVLYLILHFHIFIEFSASTLYVNIRKLSSIFTFHCLNKGIFLCNSKYIFCSAQHFS